MNRNEITNLTIIKNFRLEPLFGLRIGGDLTDPRNNSNAVNMLKSVLQTTARDYKDRINLASKIKS